jgi:hypothetical protein
MLKNNHLLFIYYIAENEFILIVHKLRRSQFRNWMDIFKRNILPVLLATVWVSISEFVRNELLLRSYWTSHYRELGIVFPSDPINGLVWGLWSLCFALTVFLIARKNSLVRTTVVSWFAGFVLMWIVLWNMSVLPLRILFFAVPLSLLETFLAALIIKKLTINKNLVQSL